MSEVAVRAEHVAKRFRIYHQRHQTLKQTVLTGRRARYEEFWALKDVSLEIPQGTTFGIIGENGSGKSTLLKCIAGILKPDEGSVEVSGRLAALLELGAGFHPEYTGRENIYLNGALMGLSRKDVDKVLEPIIAFSELARFIDNPVKTYSSGMYARLGFSISVHLDPEILVVDEILAVGDESFQRRCYARIDQMKAEGRTLIIVSHALDTIRDHCKDCAWLEHGQLRAMGPVESVVKQYLEEVRGREEAAMAAAVEQLHREVPSGRAGVGVSSVTFIGPKGPGLTFRSGDDLEVAVDYHSAADSLRNVNFSIDFLREDGTRVFSTGVGARRLPRSGVVRLRMPALPLVDGVYRLSVTIADLETGEPYTLLANAFPIRIEPNGGGAAGLVRLPHAWQLPDGARPAARARTAKAAPSPKPAAKAKPVAARGSRGRT